jgi:hypothetical protein
VGAFVDGARVRAAALTRIAHELGGAALEDEVRALVAVDADAPLPQLYATHERAAVRLAEHLDAA